MKPRKSKNTDRSDSEDSMEQSRQRKKDKLAALKSTIVLKKQGQGSDSDSPAQWSGEGMWDSDRFV